MKKQWEEVELLVKGEAKAFTEKLKEAALGWPNEATRSA